MSETAWRRVEPLLDELIELDGSARAARLRELETTDPELAGHVRNLLAAAETEELLSRPAAEFAALQIENFAVRDRILLRATIGLRYETTPDQLRHLLFQLRELIAAHPRLGGQPTRVRFDGFGAAALNVEVCTYALTADYEEFLAIREEVYLRVMELVAASGTGFAVPLPVPHRPGPGLDPREAGPRPTPPPAS